jgi:hypothetical protein
LGDDSANVTNLLAAKFIQRRDAKAIQYGDGYMPVTDTGKADGERLAWTRADLEAHVAGTKSFGHYLVDLDGKCKLFAFDIDLSQPDTRAGRAPTWVGIEEDGSWTDMEPKTLNPREAWHHPKAPENLRRFLMSQLHGAAVALATTVTDAIGCPVAVAYSGNKGVHVYGLIGSELAGDVREAANEVINFNGGYEPLRGKNFFRHSDDDPIKGFPCIDVEIFPKQDNLSGKDLGNLMRLPLGVHGKSKQRAYFVTLSSPIDSLTEMDPVKALEGDPWA